VAKIDEASSLAKKRGSFASAIEMSQATGVARTGIEGVFAVRYDEMAFSGEQR
jgi:hypothetical protein